MKSLLDTTTIQQPAMNPLTRFLRNLVFSVTGLQFIAVQIVKDGKEVTKEFVSLKSSSSS